MAQPVPYTGAPESSPKFDPTPAVGVNTPPEAFGVNIGEAVEHLGTVDEKAGGELLDRAFAMQELHAHAEANSAIADFQNQSINSSVDYGLTEGKNAVDGLGPFVAGLDKSRENIGANLSSPYAQFLYDQESRQSRFRIAFNASDHARTEGKKYIIGSGKARIQSLESEAELDPDNPGANKDRLTQIKQTIETNNTMAGLQKNDPQWDVNIKDATSSYIGSQVRGLAMKDPFKAQKLLDQAMGDKDLMAGTIDAYGRNSIQRLQDYVDDKLRTVGSRVVSHEVMSGEGARFGEGKLSPSQLLSGLKASEGGAYNFVGPTVTDASGHRGQAIGHYGVMSYNLEGWLAEAGMPAMSIDQFRASPDVQDRLAAFKMGQYQDKYGSANAAAIAWFGGEGSVGADLQKLHDKNMNGLQYLRNFNSGLAQTASLGDVRAVGAKVAEEHAPGNGMFSEAVDQRISGHWDADQKQQRDDEFNNKQTLDDIVAKGYLSGKPPGSIEELTATPEAKAAWDALRPSDQLAMMGTIAKDAKGDIPRTPEREVKYGMLQGLLPEQPDKFLKATENPVALDLPWDMRQKIISQRQQVYKKTYADPQVTHALGVLQDQLLAAGLDRASGDQENRALFTGLLHDAMQQHQVNNNKPMSDEDIKLTGNQILKRMPGKWFGNTPWFETVTDVPEDIATVIRSDPSWGGVEPTKEMIRRVYIGAQFQELYGKKSSAPKAGQ